MAQVIHVPLHQIHRDNPDMSLERYNTFVLCMKIVQINGMVNRIYNLKLDLQSPEIKIDVFGTHFTLMIREQECNKNFILIILNLLNQKRRLKGCLQP